MIITYSLFYLLVFVLPVLYMVRISLHTGLGVPNVWAGLKNYERLLVDPLMRNSLWVTIKFALMTMPIQIVLGYLCATAIRYVTSNARLRTALGAIMFFPALVPLPAMCAIWKMLLGASPSAPINSLLGIFGIPPVTWLVSPDTALLSLALASLWGGIGFATVLFLAGLTGLRKDIIEAAEVDGAGTFRCWIYMVIPMLRGTIAVIWTLLLAGSMLMYAQVDIMTGVTGRAVTDKGGPVHSTDTLVWEVYMQGFVNQDKGYAATLSLAIMVAMLLLAIPQLKRISQTSR